MKRVRKAKPAASAKSKLANGGVPVDLIDALNDQRCAAEGNQLAVMGQASMCRFDSSPIERLLDEHIAAIRSRSESLQKLAVVA